MFLPLFYLLSLLLLANADGDVSCSGTGWYTDMVGETPCTTYERLRQICNPGFQVGTMNVSLPPDICFDQVADCCCNSVAFGLSMLCLNCQQGIDLNGNIDAVPGTYERYLQGPRPSGQWCSPVSNQSLPSNIDTAVCDSGIKIIDDLYARLWWGDGSWFYTYSTETISKDVAANDGNAFTHCASVKGTSTTTSTSSSTPSTSVSQNSGNIVTTASQAPGTTTNPSAPSPSDAVSNSPASGITNAVMSGAEATSTIINGLSISSLVSSSIPTSVSGNGSATGNSSQTVFGSSPHLSKGTIGGIAAGAIVVTLCALLALWFLCRSRMAGSKDASVANTLRELGFASDTVEVDHEGFPHSEATTESSTSLIRRPDKLEVENIRNSGTELQSQSTSNIRENFDQYNNQRIYSRSDLLDAPTSTPGTPTIPVRHTDAGLVQLQMAERRISGSLPPAYGEQIS